MSNVYNERFRKLVDLDDTTLRILDSIRYKDEDLSVKSGALLAFSGLMIATAIVQLSTSQGSIVYIPRDYTLLMSLNALGLVSLFFSSIVSLLGLLATGKYSDELEVALIQFDDYTLKKNKKIKLATFFCLCGTSLVSSSLMIVLASALFQL